MSTDLVIQGKAKTLQALLEVSKKQIEAALPRHLTPDRLLRIAMTEARKNPALLDCTQASFLGAIIQTAQLGLEPGGALGHAYLVPYKNKKLNTLEAQFIVGYRGMIDLGYRSPLVGHIIARAVYEGDKFSYQYGTEERIDHQPDMEANGKDLTHVYAIIFLKNGGKIFDVMELKEIQAAQRRSASGESGPWVTDFEAMAKKTVVRRLFKYSPVSIEMQNAIGMDEAAERGEQFNGAVIETTGTHVPDATPPAKTKTFQDNVSAAEPRTAPVQSLAGTKTNQAQPEAAPAPGSFQDFSSSNLFDSTPPPAETAPPVQTKPEIVSDIFAAAEEKEMDITDIESTCWKAFKKKPGALDVPELLKVLETIQNSEKKQAKKAVKK